jgi:NAD(P)-dependent dehydrogenase (short-subunit alcohol dehydrogenase family)
VRIEGSRVWLTGASSGIGAALARALASRGARVALFARRREELEALARDLERSALAGAAEGAAGAPRVLVQPGDVTDHARVRDAVREAEAAFGGLDIAILNAGVGDSLPAAKLDAAVVRRVFEVNLLGAVHGIEAVLGAFLERGDGVIVGVSSVAGYRGLPQSAPYCASKAALAVFLESLRIDLAPRGIRVLTVSPGFVKTPLTDRNRFPMPFLLAPERAATRILRGIERETRDIHFPWRLTVPMKLVRLLPVWLYDPVFRWLGERQRGSFKSSGPSAPPPPSP